MQASEEHGQNHHLSAELWGLRQGCDWICSERTELQQLLTVLNQLLGNSESEERSTEVRFRAALQGVEATQQRLQQAEAARDTVRAARHCLPGSLQSSKPGKPPRNFTCNVHGTGKLTKVNRGYKNLWVSNPSTLQLNTGAA